MSVRPSGRYSVTKNGKTRYFAADGTELNEKYYKSVECPDVKVKSSDGKTYNLNGTLSKRINNVSKNLEKAEDENGFIGKGWSGFKNLTGIGDSSDKVRELQKSEKKLLAQFNANPADRAKVFKQLTGVDYNQKNMEAFIKGKIKLKSEQALSGYKEGQAMAVDVVADVVSGGAAFGIYTMAVAEAPFTGGASLVVGFGAAAITGATVKVGVKAADAWSGGQEYTLTNAGHDAATGAFSGVLAPVTVGAGGAVGKTVTVQVGKAMGKTALKETTKQALTKGTAFTAEMATDGTLGGGVDNAFRTAIDGGSAEEVLDAGLTGAKYGAVLGPVMGWGGKGVGKTYKAAKGALTKADDVVSTPTVKPTAEQAAKSATKAAANSAAKPTRAELKNLCAAGKKVNVKPTTDADIKIPKGRLRAPSSKFAETDEAFRNIVRNHPQEFYELSQKSGDEFIREAFRLCKKYMGLEDAPIGLEIGNWSASEASVSDAVIRIGRNWKNGDKAELLGAVAHELDHMFQYKEMQVNSLLIDDINYIIKPELKEWINNNSEFWENHNEYYYNKGKVYSENFANYVEPDVDYVRYRTQPVEVEAHRRGDLVRDEFKKLISTNNRVQIKLDVYEQKAVQQIEDYFSKKYPNINNAQMQEIIDDAVSTMKKPEYSNMNYEQFVRYFVSLYD